jgi:hypothetical protein
MSQLYDLKGYKPRRPQGLTVAGYTGSRLLQTINRPIPPTSSTSEMRLKSYARPTPSKNPLLLGKANDSAKENIGGPPEGSSDDDNAADIKPTVFGKRSTSPTLDVDNSKAGTGGNRTKKAVVNGKGTRTTLIEKIGASPSSSSWSSTSKRKSQASQEDPFLGRGMLDPFGRITKKKVRSTYGSSSQSRPTSNQPVPRSKKLAGSPPGPFPCVVFESLSNIYVVSRQGLHIPELLDSPVNSPEKPSFWKPDDLEESPMKPNTPTKNGFVRPKLEHTPVSTPGVNKGFKNPGQVDSPSILDSEGGGSFTDLEKLEDTLSSTPPSMKKLLQKPTNVVSFKRDPNKLLELKNYDLGGDLAARVQNIIGQDGKELGVDSGGLFDNDFDTSTTVEARCPMCNQPCDAAELSKWGTMNTRQQERFCRFHRKTTAENKWSSKGYPKIDWERLDSRISKRHDFIKDLLNGAVCHYRKTFEELVAAGKGRALRKMDSNLTPGYYGSRGLNMISEHVIREFSGLLSKRSVKDRLISKRGTTAFVQSVIVPEVAVQLIMEDMSIDDAEARDVLTESANIGELVHEEIGDVVVERAGDSDDDDNEND